LGSTDGTPGRALDRLAGAAHAAGLATGFWSGLDDLRANYTITRRWQPEMDSDERARGVAAWRRGVDRTLGLMETGHE
jgi:glycerol kinase